MPPRKKNTPPQLPGEAPFLVFSSKGLEKSLELHLDETTSTREIKLFIMEGIVRSVISEEDPESTKLPQFDAAVREMAQFYLDHGFAPMDEIS